MITKLILVLCLSVFVLAKNEIYKGYKVYNVKVEKEEQLANLGILKSDVVDFWRYPSVNGIVGRAMVPASHYDWFEEGLQKLGIEVDIFVEDVYEYLKRNENIRTTASRNNLDRNLDITTFYRYDEIIANLRALETQYENSTSISLQVVDAGSTNQGRTLVYVTVSAISNVPSTKPIIVIEAATVAREWITIPAALNIINNLLNETQPSYLQDFDWIIVPVLNPDGYEYTHTNTRLWVKSRRYNGILALLCPGVNINRNFDVEWGNADSSSTACSETFAGSSAFSEAESSLVSSLIEDYGSRIRMYISLQNKGGIITYPWNYERAASGLFIQHHLIGVEMLKVIDGNYTLGVSSVELNTAAGTSTDYARRNGVRFTYNFDILQHEEGGFDVPSEDIPRIVDDVWKAVAVAADNILNY